MANMTFGANLLPKTDSSFSLGSSGLKWNIYGTLNGNASTATALTSSAGSSSLPVYFSGGKPTVISSLTINSASGTSGAIKDARTNGSSVWLGVGSGDVNHGVYSETLGKWIVYANASSVYLNGNAETATKATQDASGNTITSTYVKKAGDTMTGNLIIAYATDATMTADSTNPKITFSENGTQPVHLIYTDYDSYRSPAGLKVIGGTSATPAWFEVEGKVYASAVYGAVWNDYAEFRQANSTIPGYCVIENGDDTLSLSAERLQKGAEIISDTFGFAIGKTDECQTPIAATGRVLAYTYEPREEYRKHIGDAVCSGPDGKVSIMTEEEETKYPSRIIGFVSAVPDYEEWGTGKVKVDGRVWIRVR